MDRKADKILRLLAEKYPSKEAVYSKIIHLQAELKLPKAVEHFMSDLHGEYASFFHILNNCSGVIREKVEYVFGGKFTEEEMAEFCTLIYYPREKIAQLAQEGVVDSEWYRQNISNMLEIAKVMSYKYTSPKIKSSIPSKYESVIEELMHTRPDVDNAQFVYHKQLLDSIVATDSAVDFIYAFTELIKRLAVVRLHIVGDFFDRGNRPDAILNRLMRHPKVDIQWGNHDVLWMGAALGSEVCIATVVRNSLRYNNTDVLERGYGINLRPFITFASHSYPDANPIKAGEKAAAILMFKLEGQMIRRNPDFQMDSRLLLDKIDFKSSYAVMDDGKRYELKSAYFPTVDENAEDPYALTPKEEELIADLKTYFVESAVLQRHIDYLYQKGSIYTCHNGNLLFHGCVPMNEDGTFREIEFDGKIYKGKAYFDYVDLRARQAYLKRDQKGLDFMYFLWCGLNSPMAGREFKTFERAFLSDEKTWKEPSDPYFKLINEEGTCEKVLEEFGLPPERGHIINGHVPVKVKKGETPIKAGGRAIVIDGGFCKAYHKKTGISGFTLVSNSRGLRLLEHQKIADVKAALKENGDIESVSETIELQNYRTTVGDTDAGQRIKDEIEDLKALLDAYNTGVLQPKE
ncbi:MAG: fructose-1,6-bisphosphatase [Selenomonadaceae bacterium]|nr:fructose-1,6-bisphosphatase [Selenomonadaceae bacterium]